MDHKVSKDMISSGMTPSGEKTQADLGRTQYGSAPSPSKLMDAYKSMYKEENLGGDTSFPPFTKEKVYDPKASGRQKFVSQLNKKTPVSGPGQGKPTVGKVKTRKVDPQTLKNNPRADVQTNSFDLLAAYRAVYEHHKKDADGNTIPHEDEEVNEGKIPAGLQAYLDKKKGKKEDKKEVKEESDLFDVISTHFINEGYEEKDVYKAMASLTEDQLQNLDEAIPLIGGALAALGKVGAGIGAKVAAAGGAKAIAAKGLASAGKMATGAAKGIASTAKGVASVPGKISSGVKNIGGAVKNFYGNKKISPFIKQAATSTATDLGMRAVGGMKPRGLQKRTSGTISADADLFDIVKGQLLDEGLSEEEIKDIMLTLTPDEIMSEMNAGPSTPVKNYGDSPDKPKILPNFGATRAKPRTTDKGTLIKGGKDTGKTPAQMSKEEYKGSGTPEQQAAMKAQVEISKKVNRYGGKTPSGTTAVDAKKGIEDVRKSM